MEKRKDPKGVHDGGFIITVMKRTLYFALTPRASSVVLTLSHLAHRRERSPAVVSVGTGGARPAIASSGSESVINAVDGLASCTKDRLLLFQRVKCEM